MAARHATLVVNKLSDQSCTRGMTHNKIHFINPRCLRLLIALQFTIMEYNTIHFTDLLTMKSSWQYYLNDGVYGSFNKIIAEPGTLDPPQMLGDKVRNESYEHCGEE